MTSEEERWLLSSFPGLVLCDEDVTGTISFTATYNGETELFLRLDDDATDDVGGIRLSCSYRVHIKQQPQSANPFARLPTLRVDDLEPTADRHFRKNKNACLCSPMEESDFLSPQLDFRRFVEELVIPFLYGQSFYSAYHRWPWPEYAHNATGLLEAFHDRPFRERAGIQRFLLLLCVDSQAWPSIRATLGRGVIKGHVPCFCDIHDQIRRCHPKALLGLRLLHQLVRSEFLTLPDGNI
jgi:hypothetical protein